MNIQPISNNTQNTNFKATFIPNNLYKEVRTNPFYLKGFSDETETLFNKLNKIGEGQSLEITKVVSFNFTNNVHESGLEILNKSNGKKQVFIDSIYKPFWDKILKQLIGNKEFFE